MSARVSVRVPSRVLLRVSLRVTRFLAIRTLKFVVGGLSVLGRV